MGDKRDDNDKEEWILVNEDINLEEELSYVDWVGRFHI
jgi:hypothetical protein